jgi:enoyl-CoA hydratase/carnithine racemase
LVSQKTEEDGVEILILRHPPVNALSTPVLDALETRIRAIEANVHNRCVVLTGEGQYFSAGADLKEMESLSVKHAPEMIGKVHAMFTRIENLHCPVIAAINGLALGGGLELALSCDLRIAGESAKLGATEVNYGLMPAYGGTQRLPRLVGTAKAKEWIFTGSMISAPDALEFGLTNRTVPAGQELRAARDLAHSIAQKAPKAVAAAKRAILQGIGKSLSEGLRIEAAAFEQEVLPSEDLREGIAAFLERRPPKFRGT